MTEKPLERLPELQERRRSFALLWSGEDLTDWNIKTIFNINEDFIRYGISAAPFSGLFSR